MNSKNATPDTARNLLLILLFSFLTIGSFWILRPFLSAIVWATMIVIPTWPMMLAIQKRTAGRRSLAVLCMSLILCLLVFVPVGLMIKTIVTNMDTIASWVQSVENFEIPEAPGWISKVPLIGEKIAYRWNNFGGIERQEIAAKLAPFLVDLVKQLPTRVGNVGMLLLHFLLTMILAIILYCQGERAAAFLRAFARRLAGKKGEQTVWLVALSIKAVAMGIVVTAFVQAAFAGIGLAVAGIPYALLLTALIFALSIVQIGAGPVLLAVIIWLYWSGQTTWATVFLVWSLFVVSLDNFLRPLLIRRGADLPLLLIFAGVIGGLISFGLLGLFIGPVILAVTYTLFKAWVDEQVPENRVGA